MYNIEKQSWGFKLTFGGQIHSTEMQQWIEESKIALADASEKFGVFVDMRELEPLSTNVTQIMELGQKLYKEKGMERSCVILNNEIVTMQFKRIAKESGIYAWERYLDASGNMNWEKEGIAWVKDGVDPEAHL